jgi:hypothetical protein
LEPPTNPARFTFSKLAIQGAFGAELDDAHGELAEAKKDIEHAQGAIDRVAKEKSADAPPARL